jgi:hypothetical protein
MKGLLVLTGQDNRGEGLESVDGALLGKVESECGVSGMGGLILKRTAPGRVASSKVKADFERRLAMSEREYPASALNALQILAIASIWRLPI